MSLVEQFRSSSPGRQFLLVLGAALVIGAALSAAYFMVLRRPYSVLFANLRSADAATIVGDLDKRKTPYRLAQGGSIILVPQDKVDVTRLAIANEDLPLKGVVGFELFNKSDMGLTEFAQKINYQRALQGELARTIMTMEAVDSARVHLSIADPSLFRDDRRPSKASITLTLRSGKSLSRDDVLGIQRLVASAVPDLSTDDVVVLSETGATISGSPATGQAGGVAPEQQERQAVEQYYEARIRMALASAPAAAEAQVAVTALTEPSPVSIEGRAAALAAWTPAGRAFPLAVSVALPSPPDEAAKTQIQAAVTQAVGLDAKKGDTLSMDKAAKWEPAAAETSAPFVTTAPAPAAEAAPAQTGLSATAFWETRLIPLLLALLIAAFLLHRLRGGKPRLTAAQRERHVQRLRAFLDEGQENVA